MDKCQRCGAAAPHPLGVCVENLQRKSRELLDAARPFLRDFSTHVIEDVFQCNYCGDFAPEEEDIKHHETCQWRRLKQAIGVRSRS